MPSTRHGCRFGAEINDRHADARRGCIKNLILARDTDRHRVDKAIAVITLVEAYRPTDGGDAEGIAITANTGDNTGD
jgi:hypothetical protein